MNRENYMLTVEEFLQTIQQKNMENFCTCEDGTSCNMLSKIFTYNGIRLKIEKYVLPMESTLKIMYLTFDHLNNKFILHVITAIKNVDGQIYFDETTDVEVLTWEKSVGNEYVLTFSPPNFYGTIMLKALPVIHKISA